MFFEVASAVDHAEHLYNAVNTVQRANGREQRGEDRKTNLAGRLLAALHVEIAAHAASHQRAIRQQRTVARHIQQLSHHEARRVDAQWLRGRGQREGKRLKTFLRGCHVNRGCHCDRKPFGRRRASL